MKSKLGIHIGFLACLCFLVGYFMGGISLIALVGYILIAEDSDFVRISAVKSLLIVLFVSVLHALVGLLPDVFDFINWFTRIFNADTQFNSTEAISKINQIFDFIDWIIDFCKKILMLLLAFMACGMKTIKVPFIEGLIAKYARRDRQQ
ncbi:MAG: hypothetical protein IKR27_09785 [Lachnospiraceae bacterium]|nr:hypothetical protein [Lachnospiraceae bacterium]MBR6275284.1 hypothetical protein [Lachnospiraceae bacterium]